MIEFNLDVICEHGKGTSYDQKKKLYLSSTGAIDLFFYRILINTGEECLKVKNSTNDSKSSKMHSSESPADENSHGKRSKSGERDNKVS